MADKDIEKLVAGLRRDPRFTVKKTAKNYYLVRDAANGEFVVCIPSTPSSPRTLRRIKSTLAKRGFEES